MIDTIRVCGDKETEYTEHLKNLYLRKIAEIAPKLNLKKDICKAIFFVPMIKGKSEALGQFVWEGEYILLSEKLLDANVSDRDIENVFLHEMAHALDHSINGFTSGHSPLFREYCSILGVDKDFSKSKVKLSIDKKERYSAKLEKIIAMQSSPFENEAMIAIAKAQQLMLDEKLLDNSNNEKIYMIDLVEGIRLSFATTRIAYFVGDITGVYVINISNGKSKIIRAYGSLDEVEFAIYLYKYMTSAIDREIKKLRKKNLSINKNIFTFGMLDELGKKLNTISSDNSNQLMVIKEENKEKAIKLSLKAKVTTSKRKTNTQYSAESMKRGCEFGKTLKVPQKIEKKEIT